MADINVTGIEPEKISSLEKLVRGVTLYRFKKDGDAFVRLVPARLVTQEYAEESCTNWVRKFYYVPSRFDFDGLDLVDDFFVPTRKQLGKAVVFTSFYEEDTDGARREWLKIESLNDYLDAGTSKELSTEKKKEFFDQATLATIDFLCDRMTPDTRRIVEALEYVIRTELEAC